jgi:hypothetical protein
MKTSAYALRTPTKRKNGLPGVVKYLIAVKFILLRPYKMKKRLQISYTQRFQRLRRWIIQPIRDHASDVGYVGR